MCLNYFIIGITFNFIIFILGVIKFKSVKYLKKSECNRIVNSKGEDVYYLYPNIKWITRKLYILYYIYLSLLNLIVPYLGGIISYWILNTYFSDMYSIFEYYSKEIGLGVKIDTYFNVIHKILKKLYSWLYYKI